jgi:xanthine phosphoribosyltransferase
VTDRADVSPEAPIDEAFDDPGNPIVSWAEVHRDARYLVRKLLAVGPWAGIVAVSRGGLVPAAIVAREMGIRLVDTLCIATYDDREKGAPAVLKAPERAVAEAGEGWLVVDDLADTGATLRVVRTLLPRAHVATVYAKPEGAPLVDTYVHTVDQDVWIFFPWDTDARPVAPIVGDAGAG